MVNRWPFQALAYSATTNRITTSGYAYDAAGNVTGDGTYTYTWDAEAHLTKVVNGRGDFHQHL